MHDSLRSAVVPKECNFIALQSIIQQFYYQYFSALLNYKEIFDTSAEQSDAHVLKGCIKNGSIVKLYNKVLIIDYVCKCCCTIISELLNKIFNFKLFLKLFFNNYNLQQLLARLGVEDRKMKMVINTAGSRHLALGNV